MTLIRSEIITYGVRDILADTKTVKLVTPVNGMTTQEDANIHFAERLEALDSGEIGVINCGTY